MTVFPATSALLAHRCHFRIAGGLHALVLTGRSSELKAIYPPASVSDAELQIQIKDALARHEDFLLEWVQSPPQTNEVRRSAALIPAAAVVHQHTDLPVWLSELGASGGLNLMWDHFALELPNARMGPKTPTLMLTPDWEGPLPPLELPKVADRAGVDLNPLDLSQSQDLLRLTAYLWPDQPERLQLTKAAAALMKAPVTKADAIDWLEKRLIAAPTGHVHLIQHTVAWQYFPVEAQSRGRALIEQTGASATPARPLAWLALESDGDTKGALGAALTLRFWPGDLTFNLGSRRLSRPLGQMVWRAVMRVFGKWLGRLLLALLVAGLVIGFSKREELNRLMAVNTIFDPNKIVANFSNMDNAFLHTDLPRGEGPVSQIDGGQKIDLPAGMSDWMAERHTTSLVVLKNGALVFEGYYLDTGPEDLRISWSLAKSFISTLTGAVLADGAISSLDDPVTKYAPSLAGGAYEGATLRNVLNMSTGVTFDEDYLDYDSDINRMGRILALGGLMDDFAAGLTKTFAVPGTDWQYVSIDTHVIGMVLRGATGRSVVDLMAEKIIAPLGLEQTPYYLTDGAGVAFALGGLNLTTRDYARFGQMVLQGGEWQNQQIVPKDWILESTTPSAPTEPDEYGYGYQWWIPRDARPREYMGRGIYGQYLYINELQATVVALTAADPDFRDLQIQDRHISYFRQIADGP